MKRSVPILWYENEQGDRWYPPDNYNGVPPPPDGFRYQWFRNPCELHESVCPAAGGPRIMSGTASWDPDLVMAMVRPWWLLRFQQFLSNGGRFPRRYKLDAAIVKVATSCERCLNALAYEYQGIEHGYRRFGPSWRRSNTRCEDCDPDWMRPAGVEVPRV